MFYSAFWHRATLMAVLLFAFGICAVASTPEWGRILSVNGDGAAGLAIDLEGNLYWSGNIRNGTLNGSSRQTGLFLTKQTPDGSVIWSKIAQSYYGPKETHLHLNSEGKLILSGVPDTNGVLSVFAAIAEGPFAAALTSNGVLSWSRTISPSVPVSGDYPFFEATWDSNGNVIGAGDLFSTVKVDSVTLNFTNSTIYRTDAFVLNLNSNGVAQYAQREGKASVSSIKSAKNGDYYVTGSAGPASIFGSYFVEGNRGFIAKYNSDGSIKWIQAGFESVQASAARPDGKIAVVGTFTKGSGFGPFTYTPKQSSNPPYAASASLVILNPETGVVASGIFLIPNRSIIGPMRMTCDNQGVLRIAAIFNSTLSISGTPVSPVGTHGLFVAAIDSYNLTFPVLWTKTAQVATNSTLTGLEVDNAGRTYVTGSFDTTAVFDNLLVQGTGNQTFLAQISEREVSLPIITNSPVAQASFAGNSVQFTAGVSSSTPVTYQWFFNNVPIQGQTNGTFSLSHISAADAGSYFVRVNNSDGSVRSQPVELIVRATAPVLLSTISGTNIAGYNDAALGSGARFDQPNSPGITFDGNIIVPEIDNIIRIVEPNGAASLFAGNTNGGFNNGPASVALFNYPLAATVGPAGEVYVADTGNNVIRRISTFGTRNVTTYAGSGTVGYRNGAVADAQFNFPNDLVFDSKGNLFITEFNNHTVRKVSPYGNVSTFAGNGTAGYSDGLGTNSLLNMPAGITVDSSDNLYITEWSGQRIRKITPEGVVSTLAGTNVAGFVDGPGASARLSNPDGITIDPFGNIYFTEYANHAIRKLDTNRFVTTLVGQGNPGFKDGDASSALLHSPGGIAWYPDGTLIVADTGNDAIRRLRLLTNAVPSEPMLFIRLHAGLTIFGVAGKNYRIEAAESSLGPLDWTVISTITLTQPVELFFDSEPATRSQRLYRATEVQ